MRWPTGILVAGSLLLLVSCTPAAGPTPTPAPDQAARSQQVIVDAVSGPDNGPGCAAAVGKQGNVVWHGAYGLADIEAGTPITESTIFDIGSMTEQFTATTILLLAAEGKLAVDDSVSDHVDGLPAWGDDVTIDHLLHYTSGIPNYVPLLEAKGYVPEDTVGRKLAFEVIADVTKLNSKPGKSAAYSPSDYILLGYVIERVSDGAPIADVLADRVFRPLDLEMTMSPTGQVTGKARAYRVGDLGTGYPIAEFHWDTTGSGGIQSGVADLVRWGDNYRTGKLGGQALLDAQLADPVNTGEGDGTRYGAGIIILPDHGLFDLTQYGGFRTLIRTSADRSQVLAAACNLWEVDLEAMGEELAELWRF